MSSCCCCHCCCCGCGCCHSCGCQNPDQEVGGVSLTDFPVYVSYPAFFPPEGAVEGANEAIFISPQPLTTTGARTVLTRSSRRSCGCRR